MASDVGRKGMELIFSDRMGDFPIGLHTVSLFTIGMPLIRFVCFDATVWVLCSGRISYIVIICKL